MIRLLILAIVAGFASLCASSLSAKRAEPLLKILVIDSGYDRLRLSNEHLCSEGHQDFTGTGLYTDRVRHGSNVASLVSDAAAGASYCIIYFKIFAPKQDGETSFNNYLKALAAAAARKDIDIINLSLGGRNTNNTERRLLKQMLDRGVQVVTAAGNDAANLDLVCNYYPACLDSRIIVVGCKECSFSNTGRVVDMWYNGMDKLGGGVIMSGTSMSTAIASGRLALFLHMWYVRFNHGINRRKQLAQAAVKERGK